MEKSVFVDGVCEKYPDQLLEGRMNIEGNMLACLFDEPTMYDDIAQQVGIKNFLTKDGRLLFGIVKFLREKRFNVIDEVTVLSNCPEDVKDRLVGIGGWKRVQKMMNVVDVKNWDGIFDAFNKSNILLRLYSRGFNIFEKVKLGPNKKGEEKEVVPFEMFKKPDWDSSSVIGWYEEFVSNIGIENTSSSTKIIDNSYAIIDDKFFDDINKGEASGYSFGDAGTDIKGNNISVFPYLSRNILGFARGTTNAIAGHSGSGKSTLMMNVVFSFLSQGLKGVYISNEMSKRDIMNTFLLIILTRYFGVDGITKQKLKTGDLSEDDWKNLRKASAYWNETYGQNLKIVTMSDADSNISDQIIKKEYLRNNIDFFVIDTFKLDVGNGNGDNNFWIDLIVDSRALDSIAKKYNLVGMYTIQLTATTIGNLFLDASALSTSKGIKEVLSNLLMIRKIYPEERLPGSAFDFKPFRSKRLEDGSWKDEPYELEDPNAVYRCLFVDKSRGGADSGDCGVAYLLKFRGEQCKFSETAKVRPVHKKIMQ